MRPSSSRRGDALDEDAPSRNCVHCLPLGCPVGLHAGRSRACGAARWHSPSALRDVRCVENRPGTGASGRRWEALNESKASVIPVGRVRVLLDSRLAVRGLGIGSATQRLSDALMRTHRVELSVNVSQLGWTSRGKVDTLLRSGMLDVRPSLDLRTRHADAVHYFSNSAPRFPDRRTVITVQDLMSMRSRALKAQLFTALLVPGLIRAAPAGSVVVPTSTQTADEIKVLLAEMQPRIEVIPHGWRDGLFFGGVRDHVFMFGGQSDPRKRVELGLAAYSAYAESTRDPLPLIIAGRAGIDTATVAQYVTSGNVKVELDPSNERVARLLQTAACLIYPTREEGFGLPLVEAGEVGTPVVCGADARIPHEPLGPHTSRVVGTQPADWGRAIGAAIKGGPVADALRHLPTWDQVANTYCDLYESVTE